MNNEPKDIILKSLKNSEYHYFMIDNITSDSLSDYFEKNYKWHGKPPTKEEGEMAILELKKNYPV